MHQTSKNSHMKICTWNSQGNPCLLYTSSNVVLPFTKIPEGDDAGKWKATVRLLGVTGTEQLLTAEIRYADGNPSPTTLKSDLTEALKEFNTRKRCV